MKKNLLYLGAVVALLASCTKALELAFTVSNNNVYVGDNISFAATTANAKSHLWNFGDGTRSIDASTSHSYAKPGTYLVEYTAFNKKKNAGGTESGTAMITVWDWYHKYEGVYNTIWEKYPNSLSPFGTHTSGASVMQIHHDNLVKGTEVEVELEGLPWLVKGTVGSSSFSIANQNYNHVSVDGTSGHTITTSYNFQQTSSTIDATDGSITFIYSLTTSASDNGTVVTSFDTYKVVAKKVN